MLSYRTLLSKSLPLLAVLTSQTTLCHAQTGDAPILAPSTQIPNVGVPTSGDQGNGIVGRTDREKSAPQVMVPQSSVSALASQAGDQELFNESLKRLRTIEVSNPALALTQYRQFLVGRQVAPIVGVQIALKVAQLRQSIKDYQGAALTCDVFSKKFATASTSVLLQIEKARALQNQGQLAQASDCISRAMPQILSLGPSSYEQTTTTLLQIAKEDLGKGPQGFRQASALYSNVELIYFTWLKGGMIPHTWQLFEALQNDYVASGDQKRANELLPKAAAALVAMAPSTNNPEGADASVMAARWLTEHGDTQSAQILYAKASAYGNSFVSQVALTDQGQRLLVNGQPQVALDLMLRNSPNGLEFGPKWIIAQAYWQLEDWPKAEQALLKIENSDLHGGGSDELRAVAQAHLETLREWKNKTFNIPLHTLIGHPDDNGVYHSTLYVHSFEPQSIEVSFVDDQASLSNLIIRRQNRVSSGVLVTTYDLCYKANQTRKNIKAIVELKSNPQTKQEVELNLENDNTTP